MAPTKTPALRPGPVAVESPASQPLHHLQSELLSAKARWEQLGIRIGLGYTEAYKQHTTTLQIMKKEKTSASYEALLFVFSIVSVGFAGGLVGGLLSRWVKEQGISAAKEVFRSSISGVGQQGAKDLAKVGTKTILAIAKDGSHQPSNDPYTTSSMSDIATDQAIRDNIGSAFGPLLEAVDAMIEVANQNHSPVNVGQEILNNFRANCPLMVQRPDESDMPAVSVTHRAAELAMWVAWAAERDWPWWNERYKVLDYLRLSAEKQAELVAKQDPGYRRYAYGRPQTNGAKEDALTLTPVLNRMLALDKWGAVYDSALVYYYKHVPKTNDWRRSNEVDYVETPEGISEDEGSSIFYLDLRKLRDLPLNQDARLPFRRLQGLSNTFDKSNPLKRIEFLSRTQNIKPSYM